MTNDGQKRRILLGRISGAHGIRGDVIVKTFTGRAEDIASYGPLFNADQSQSFKLTVLRASPKGVIARVAGVGNRNAAEALAGQDLFVARDRLPAASGGEYYYADLIGLACRAADGRVLGRVVAIQNFGAGDLIEMQPEDGGATVFISFNSVNVPAIDLENGTITLNLPEYTGEPEPQD